MTDNALGKIKHIARMNIVHYFNVDSIDLLLKDLHT